ncbi:hypothetical protein PAXRUDRAFT_15697 [Paxillus rubicundulus Ve08.2h10]|uniref:Uncharacterized protein n=1 Tax=Paxillus rubicundulus Ve08.2h10 TaxID=930991 RepID=A0A0D0CYA2_9AGAM|nr:hypothetical protein PAXRUDRAFT_15697 [Paxillus rubicundulus Ve08.2h10]
MEESSNVSLNKLLSHSIPPLSISSQLLCSFKWVWDSSIKSICDPHYPGHLPFWVFQQYWDDVYWLGELDVGKHPVLGDALQELFGIFQVLGWGELLYGPAAALCMDNLVDFLALAPMKGQHIDAMISEI